MYLDTDQILLLSRIWISAPQSAYDFFFWISDTQSSPLLWIRSIEVPAHIENKNVNEINNLLFQSA